MKELQTEVSEEVHFYRSKGFRPDRSVCSYLLDCEDLEKCTAKHSEKSEYAVWYKANATSKKTFDARQENEAGSCFKWMEAQIKDAVDRGFEDTDHYIRTIIATIKHCSADLIDILILPANHFFCIHGQVVWIYSWEDLRYEECNR